jgi:hypothetical protein
MDYMEIFGRKLFHKYISERARQQVCVALEQSVSSDSFSLSYR